MAKFTFSDLGTAEIPEIQFHARRHLGDDVSFDPEEPSLGLGSEITEFYALLVAIMALCLQLQESIRNTTKDSTWTADRLAEIIRTELLKLGIAQFHIIEVKNFDALTKGSTEPCRVLAQSSVPPSETVRLYVFRQGDVYHISGAS